MSAMYVREHSKWDIWYLYLADEKDSFKPLETIACLDGHSNYCAHVEW